jgi:AP endonuclease-1
MSRRTKHKIDYRIPDEESSEDIAAPISTPKKGRKVVKVESTKVTVTTKIEKSTPTKSRKVKAEVDPNEEDIAVPAKLPTKVKVSQVKVKAVLEGESAPKTKKAPAPKRKAKTEDDEDEDKEGAGNNKGKKKRKTKQEKEAEAMPLAERTAIGALKKAMHIGAHVSAAGGAYFSTLQSLTSPNMMQVSKTPSIIPST